MMDKLITAFPQNLLDALEIAAASSIRMPAKEIRSIVICGMGGSGIGGKIVSQWVQDDLKVPIYILNDYSLPAFVGEHSLVIGSSYSGNTEETLEGIHEAHKRGAHIIGICSGGDLKEFCIENGFDCVIVPGGNPPRTQLAFSMVQLLNILVKLRLINASVLDEIQKSYELIKNELSTIYSDAERLAEFLQGKVGIIYSGPKYEGVAIRARQQFNENSKLLCWHHVIPEMNHNELVGWGGGDDRFAVVFLNTGDLIPRNQKRYNITKDLVSKKCSSVMEVCAVGDTRIQRSIYLIHLVDWASFYLSGLHQVDPMDISVIDFLKDELANFH
jgi:glucose/mannose-6-phosphate isomerase